MPRRRQRSSERGHDGQGPSPAPGEGALPPPRRCRSWWSLTSDPTFVAAHRARHPEPLIIVGLVSGEEILGGV
ncbi:hypothetical protein ACP4OV_011614 [Aristida adscensionis]